MILGNTKRSKGQVILGYSMARVFVVTMFDITVENTNDSCSEELKLTSLLLVNRGATFRS